MKCGNFPSCSLDCVNCPDYIEDNTPKDELLEYIESNEADAYLSSIEFHELKCYNGE